MNQTHRTVYSHALGTWVAVSETSKTRSAAGAVTVRPLQRFQVPVLTLALIGGLVAYSPQAIAQVCSEGGTIAAGVNNSFACGTGAQIGTKSHNSVAVGQGATVETKSPGSIAIGKNSTIETKANSSVAIGQNSTIGEKARQSVVIGNNAKVATNADKSTAIGNASRTHGRQAVALGAKSSSGGILKNEDYTDRLTTTGQKILTNQTIGIGTLSKSEGDQSIAVGANTYSKGNSSIAIGGDDLDFVATTGERTKWNASYTPAQAKNLNNTQAAKTFERVTGDWLVHYENNKQSTVHDPNGIDRYTTTQSGHGAVAIGVMSTANDLATSFGTRANAYGITSLALGVGSQAGVKNAATKTINGVTYTEGEGAVANGAGTKALGSESIATGAGSIAYNKSDIAIGDGAVAGTDGNNGLFDNKAIAIGTGAQATGKQSISIGTGNVVSGDNSGTLGDPSINAAAASYTFGNDNAAGSTSSEVFVLGNNNQIGATVNKYNGAGQIVVANGITDTAAVQGSVAIGNHNYINTSGTYVLGSNVNVQADGKTPLGNTVANSVYLGDKTTVTAGNAVGTKNLTQAGVAGATTTAGDKGTVNSATVGGVTYGGFAGATADGAVSVGAAGSERRVQNVAAGEISATSTDAINGSQLYSVAKNLGGKINNVEKDANAGTASAMALAGLPQAFTPGKKMVAMGGATYRGEQAIAASISTVSDNGKWVLKGMVSHSSRGHTGGTVGVGYQW